MIICQKNDNINIKRLYDNLALLDSIEISDLNDFSRLKNQLIIITDKSQLSYKQQGNIKKLDTVDLQTSKKLYTIGLYKKGKYIEEYKTTYSYITDFDITNRLYIVDKLYNLIYNNLRISGQIPINIPNFIGRSSYHTSMDICCSSEFCIDFDMDFTGELILNNCNILQMGQEQYSKMPTKIEIIETLSYISYFYSQLKANNISKELLSKCESLINEEIGNLC